VALNSQRIVQELNASNTIPAKVIFKPILKTPEEIYKACQDASIEKNCIGVMAWMHTFSPAKCGSVD